MRQLVTTALVAAMATWPLAGTAAAQADADRGRNVSVLERPRPDYEPRGVRVGAVQAFATLPVEVATTDNLFAEEADEDSDVFYALRPRLQAATTWSRHAITLAAGLDRTFHLDFPKDDIFDAFVDITGRLDLGRSGELGVTYARASLSEARGSPDQPFAARSPVEYEQERVALTGRYQFNRVRVSGELSQTEFDYSDVLSVTGTLLDQDDRDRTETLGVVRGEFAISPALAAFAQVELDHRDYDLRPPATAFNRESFGRRYLVGSTFDITRLIRGEVGIGYLQQEFKDPGISDVEGIAADVSVDWFPTQLTTVNVAARRTVEETGFVGAASFLLTEGGVRVDHELRRNVILSAGAAIGRREFEGADREDELGRFDLGATYLVNRRVSLQARYERETQDSSGVDRDRDFEANRFLVGVTLRM
jgi:hypothetical protein